MAARQGEWFNSPEDVEQYMVDLSTQSGAGVSTYERATYGILYLEAAAGNQPEKCLSLNQGLKSTIQELVLRTSMKMQKKKKEAPQWLISMLIKLENMVMNESLPLYHRAYAWLKLVCFWGSLRGDDITWLRAETLRYVGGFGLQGELRRSKSTGPGKNASPDRLPF